ncbi:MAG: hemerythrin domain-containing protein [Pseudomonadota bacterium]
MTGVIDALKSDHINMLRLLEILESQVEALEQGSDPDYEVVSGIMDYCLNYPDLYHHPKEDVVFRALRKRRPEAVEKMGDLENLHGELGALTRRLAAAIHQIVSGEELDRGAVVALGKEFIAAYRHHIEMEEEYFFPVALNHLIAEDWADVKRDLRVADDPLFGSAPVADLRDLRHRVVAWHELSLSA